MRYEAPIEPSLVDELFEFWLPIFGGPIDVTPEALLGHETPQSRITVFTRRISDNLAGACLYVASEAVPAIGGLGEVATSPEARRTGIATELSRQARDDFAKQGGKAIFLGTVNPNAARIYFRLGWRKLAGANLMLNVLNGDSPEEFLVDYFRSPGSPLVRNPSPADRAPMIPLLVAPHDWQILDFNASMFSTRYATQDSCLGLYRRYSALAHNGLGAWFCASASLGEIVGLSTARHCGQGRYRIDGFTHKKYISAWQPLIQAAVHWCASKRHSRISATVSFEDTEKLALFESIGFKNIGTGEPFNLDGRQVKTIHLELL